jgi:hypothetical protein
VLWFLTVPAPPPKQGIATLEETTAALTARHERVKRGE